MVSAFTSGNSIRYDTKHDQNRTRESDQLHVLGVLAMPMVNTTAVVVNMGASSGRTQPPPP
jgi:hypothetical protein